MARVRTGTELEPDLTTKKKKNIFDRYKKYDPTQRPRGSPEQWAKMAEALALAKGGFANSALTVLGLTKVPSTVDELRQARRIAMTTAHPDKGHEAQRAIEINQAYEAILKLIPEPQRPRQASSITVGLQHPARCTGDLPDDLDSTAWAFELKKDGERFLFYLGFNPYLNEKRNTLLSRTLSTVDGQYVDRSDNAPHITSPDYQGLDGTILDGEIFLTNLRVTISIMSSLPEIGRELGKVHYHVFDILVHKGVDVKHLPLRERRKLLLEVVRSMGNPFVTVMEQRSGKIQKWFEEVVAAGGEGLVGKHQDRPYGVDWAKLKKAIDVSCIITGWRPGQKGLKGLIGSLEVSVYSKGELKAVGFVSGMNGTDRVDMTENFDRKYLGKVIDVFAYELQKSGILREGTFHRMRPDLRPEECTLEKLRHDARTIISSRTKKRS